MMSFEGLVRRGNILSITRWQGDSRHLTQGVTEDMEEGEARERDR